MISSKMNSTSEPESGTSWGAGPPRCPQGKEAEHGVYRILHGVAIRVPMRLHRAKLSDLRVPHNGVGAVPSASVRHGADLVQRLHPARASQPLPSLLQQVGVAFRYALPG